MLKQVLLDLNSPLTSSKDKLSWACVVLMCFSMILMSPERGLAIISDEDKVKQLSTDIHWLRLGHYRKTFSGYESQLDGTGFFIHEKGKSDPTQELLATWRKIVEQKDEPVEEKRIECRFAGRAEFLRRRLPEIMPESRPCPRLEKWIKTVSGPSVSLVFSSFFLNNPSSMFGHTFLRINKEASQKDGRRHELLDYGVNYAANSDQSNALMYSLKGLFGGFPGTFTIMPYYYKVREYNNAESRDLWEYELSLDSEAVELLLKHLWELGQTYADYWYLTENCSYYVLTLLEAADPRINVVDHLKKWVVPQDTLKVVYETPGLVRHVRYRPSIRVEFEERASSLTIEETNIFLKLVRLPVRPELLLDQSEDSKRRILDAALDWMDYQYAVEVQMPETKEYKEKAKLLAERSRINLPTPVLSINAPVSQQPHLSHGSRRLALGYKAGQSGHEAALLSYRFALHDMLDPVMGYPDSAQIQFFDFALLRSQKNQKWSFQDFGLFEVVTLTPRTVFDHPTSWRLKVGLERELSNEAFDVLGARISGGLGTAWSFDFAKKTTLYLGLQSALISRIEALDVLPEQRTFLVAGPLMTLRLLQSDFFATRFDLWLWPEAQKTQHWTAQGFIGTQWSISPEAGLRFGLRGNDQQSVWTFEGTFYH